MTCVESRMLPTIPANIIRPQIPPSQLIVWITDRKMWIAFGSTLYGLTSTSPCSPPSCNIVNCRKFTIPTNELESKAKRELMGAREEDGDADKEGEEEVLHVYPLQLVAHILAPLQ